jgi:type VI secretion system secreted protein VgrG
MDSLSRWQVQVSTHDDVSALESVVRAPAALRIVDEDDLTLRQIALIVTEIECSARDKEYTLQLSEAPSQLLYRTNHRIFQEKTTEQIVTKILGDSVPEVTVKPKLQGSYPVRLHCVQYGETEWSFVERLLADEGFSYFFETSDDGEPQIVFCNSLGSYDGIDGDTSIPFGPSLTTSAFARTFRTVEWEENVVAEEVHIRDLDVRNPAKYIEGKAGSGTLHYFEYPACVPDETAAKQRAKQRLEQLQREKVRVYGSSDCTRIKPGRLLTVEGVPDDVFDQKDQRFLVTAVAHEYAVAQSAAGLEAYSNYVTMCPTKGSDKKDHPPFRPALPRVPRIEQLESAITTGPGKEEIHVDHLARVKLRFLWDRSGILDDTSSTWVRCLQSALAGSMFLPRVGWEVAVGYLDGLADRPFVLGRLYNATAVVPYKLPEAAATTSFQSKSTPDSTATQEVRFKDGAGGQQVFVNAPFNQTETVGGSAKTEVGTDEDHQVDLSLKSHVKGKHGNTVGGSQKVDVGKELIIKVKGATSEAILAGELINVKGDRAVISDSHYRELIVGQYLIECNQSNTNTKGPFVRLVAGVKDLRCGLGLSESVLGARGYVCLGSRTITCSKAYSESVIAGRRTKAAAVKETAAAKLVTSASFGNITCGATKLTAGAQFSVSAKTITLEVTGSIKAGAMTLGGKFENKGFVTMVKGDVKRPKGAKYG